MPVSYPYQQDRLRDRKEKGEHPYKDAKEAMTQLDARLQAEAEERLPRINTNFAARTGEQPGSEFGA
jgi:hypothetical protein